jgi:hypothetical protein
VRRHLTAVVVVLAAAGVSARLAAESYTATATVRHGGASLSAPVRLTITRVAGEPERAALLQAIRTGPAAVRAALAALPDAGFIELGARRTPVKFAGTRPTAGPGRLVTLVTAEPVLFLGAGLPGARPRSESAVAVALIELRDDGGGLGELAPAATLGVDDQGALRIDDYGATVMWLTGIAAER